MKSVKLGNLVVSDIEPYLDVTGSFNSHLQGTVNRMPTSKEMKFLRENHKIVSFHGCFAPMGGAPLGWDEQNQRRAGKDEGADSKTVTAGLWAALQMLVFIPGALYVIYKAIMLLIVPQLP